MAVPFYQYLNDRNELDAWAREKSPDELKAYRRKKNTTSIDGLPGYTSTHG